MHLTASTGRLLERNIRDLISKAGGTYRLARKLGHLLCNGG